MRDHGNDLTKNPERYSLFLDTYGDEIKKKDYIKKNEDFFKAKKQPEVKNSKAPSKKMNSTKNGFHLIFFVYSDLNRQSHLPAVIFQRCLSCEGLSEKQIARIQSKARRTRFFQQYKHILPKAFPPTKRRPKQKTETRNEMNFIEIGC